MVDPGGAAPAGTDGFEPGRGVAWQIRAGVVAGGDRNFSLDGSNGAGWEVWLTNDGSADTTGQAYAICVDSAS